MNSVASKYHSAEIDMQLECSGVVLTVGHVGPDYLILREPAALKSRDAILRVSVDGVEERFAIRLADDLSKPRDRFLFESLA